MTSSPSAGSSAVQAMRIFAALSLLLLPSMLLVTFALHFTSFADFFNFTLDKTSYSVERFLQTLQSDDGGFRRYLLPHYIGYLSLPLFISAALTLAYVNFNKTPWHAVLGLLFSSVGVVFMGGVFGAWLSFAAIANVQQLGDTQLLQVLSALTEMQGPLMLSSALSSLTFVGMIILGVALYRNQLVARWSSALFVIGNVMILLFIDRDNWMFLGALLMCVGMAPLCVALLQNRMRQSTFMIAAHN